MLASIGQFGFLTTGQLETLHFADHSSPDAAAHICRRVLRRLRGDSLIEPLDRRIGGLHAGSSGYIWRLGPAGDRLLRASDTAPRTRRKEPSARFLEHRLAVADGACQLVMGARDGRFELVQVAVEPATWRPLTDTYGGREQLKPDLFAITASGAFEDHWFIEVDRGTESLPTVLGQCAQYERYRRLGREQAAVGLFPRVLWLVPDSHRRAQLAAAIGRADLDEALFGVHVQSELLAAITSDLTQEGGAHA